MKNRYLIILQFLILIGIFTGYSSNVKLEMGSLANGGIVVLEENGHGLVVSSTDVDYSSVNNKWNNAIFACENLILNDFNDWYLPSKKS